MAIIAIANKKYSSGFNFIDRGRSRSPRSRKGGYVAWSDGPWRSMGASFLSDFVSYVARSELRRNLMIRRNKN